MALTPKKPETPSSDISTSHTAGPLPTLAEFNKEREFAETMLNQRFNFFLLVYALIVSAAVNAHNTSEESWRLSAGR
jgi:hypothetical protein